MPTQKTFKHPGKILEEEFLKARSVSQYRVAVDTGVPPRRINEIVHGKRGITADTALRLGRYFGNDPMFWMQLQARWDLQRAQDRLASKPSKAVRVPSQPTPSPAPRRRRSDALTPTPPPSEPIPAPKLPELPKHLL